MGKHILKVTPSLRTKAKDTADLLQIAAHIITSNNRMAAMMMPNDTGIKKIVELRQSQAAHMRQLAKYWRQVVKRTYGN